MLAKLADTEASPADVTNTAALFEKVEAALPLEVEAKKEVEEEAREGV